MQVRWDGPLASSFIVALAALLPYVASVGHDLVWDDRYLVERATAAAQVGGWPALLRAEFSVDPGISYGYYRPVVLASLWLDSVIWGPWPDGYHLTNLVLHAANSLLVLFLFRGLSQSSAVAAWGAAVFAFHPVHTEAVAFVSGRTDLWAAFFSLSAALLWLRARTHLAAGRWLPLAGSAVCVGLAALSKEVAYLVPPVLVVLDRALDRGEHQAQWLRRIWPWAMAWAAALGVTLALRLGVASVGFGAAGGSTDAGAWEYWRLTGPLIPRIWGTYARLLLLPWPLKVYYTPAELDPLWVGGAAILGLVLFCRAVRPLSAVALIWTVAFLGPVSGLVPLRGALVAERFLYLPSVGICLAAGCLAARAVSAQARFAWKQTAVLGTAVALAAATGLQQRVWRSELSLFGAMVQTSPRFAPAHFNLGVALGNAGRLREALDSYATALRFDPSHAEAHYNVGVIQSSLGQSELATASFEKAVRYKPRFAEALNNLGASYLDAGRLGEAIARLEQARSARPGYPDALANLGLAYGRAGRAAQAIDAYRRLVEIQPQNFNALWELGDLLDRTGRPDLALAPLAGAARLRPGRADVAARLVAIYRRLGREREAQEVFRGMGRGAIP